MAEVQQFQFALLENLRERVRNVFERRGHMDNIEQLRDETMATIFDFPDPFASLTTSYMQDQTIKELFHPVEPEEVIISQKLCRVKRGGTRVLKTKNIYFYYVSLIKSLEQFLCNPRIFNMIHHPTNCSKNGFLKDIVNGSLFKTHPLFSVKRTALQLILYSDEIEICNPLGAHASVNKLLMFYYSLGNIEPKFRSKLPAIRLLAIAKAKDISEAGVDVILERIEKDLKKLYSGTKVKIGSTETIIFGAVISVCGDTLAQHDLAGFKSGVGFAFSKCRHCECDFNRMQSNFDENYFTPRTLRNHIRQCEEMERASTEFLKNSLMTTYGLNRRSKLVDFPAFDLIRQTPQDIMHVLLEGVVPYEMKCVLKALILSGDTELDSINAGIQCFSYSPVDVRDKPCPITVNTLSSNDNKLKQSSGQMLVFMKIFPFIVNSISTNVYVQFIIGLLEISQIIFSPVIAIETLEKLRRMIEQHLKQFTNLFPANNITPKQHYMIHFPSQIEALGPLRRHMCMRFESKHRFFKKWSSKLNYKNICKSLVQHNQIVESTQNENNIFAHEKDLGPVGGVSSFQYVESKIREFLNIVDVQHVISVKWVMLNGNTYTTGKSLIITDTDNGLPIFGLINNIFIVDSVLFCCEYQVHETLDFNRNLLSYEITVPNIAMATEFINLEKLKDYTAYQAIMLNTKMYVPRNYDLTDVLLENSNV